MKTISLKRLTKKHTVNPDGGVEDYRPLNQGIRRLIQVTGWAVMMDDKIALSQNGQFEVYKYKQAAEKVAESLRGYLTV